MKTNRMMRRIVYGMVAVSAVVAGIIVSAIAVVGTTNVIGYAFFDTGFPAALELSASGLAAAFFLALPLAQWRQAHVDVDVVANLLPKRTHGLLNFAAIAVALIVFALMAWVSVPFVERSIQFSESAQGSIPYPLWPVKLAAAFGVFVTLMVCCIQAFQSRSDEVS